jgi:glycosyltransferase involved in cell wall biosynthesis
VGERAFFVIGSLDRGGAEGQLIELAAGLVARGWAATILCLTHAGTQADRARARGVEVVVGRFQGTGARSPIPLGRAMEHARRAIVARDPDVVHTHLEWSNVIGAPAARLARTPVVVTSRLQLRDIVYAKHLKRLVQSCDAATDRLADAVVCNSRQVLADSLAAGLPARKAFVIYNGVTVPREVQPPPPDPTIAVIANLHPYKGHRFLLDAFAHVLGDRSVSERPPVLEFAGAGSEEADLRAQAERLGVAQRLRFLDSVEDVGPVIERAAFTVLPSLSEGLPNAVLESIAVGRPVIASRVGGIPEILSGGGGILVPPRDADALARAMMCLLTRPSERLEMGRRARAVAEERFSMEALIDGHEELYRRLLGAKLRPVVTRR